LLPRRASRSCARLDWQRLATHPPLMGHSIRCGQGEKRRGGREFGGFRRGIGTLDELSVRIGPFPRCPRDPHPSIGTACGGAADTSSLRSSGSISELPDRRGTHCRENAPASFSAKSAARLAWRLLQIPLWQQLQARTSAQQDSSAESAGKLRVWQTASNRQRCARRRSPVDPGPVLPPARDLRSAQRERVPSSARLPPGASDDRKNPHQS